MKLLREELAFMVKVIDIAFKQCVLEKGDTFVIESLGRIFAEAREDLTVNFGHFNALQMDALIEAHDLFRMGKIPNNGPTGAEMMTGKALAKRIAERNGYIVFWKSRKFEIYSDTTINARDKFCAENKVPKAKEYLIRPMLAERDGKPVTHTADF